jgi:16S rRNA processing protein RimM
MAYISNILLGRITKLSGYEGAVAVKLEKIFTENIPQMESVFLEIDGRPVPFFISEQEYAGADILKLSFDGYNSIEKVSEFTGCRVFLTGSPDSNSKITESQILIGYLVIGAGNARIGSISEIISNNGQWLLNVISADRKNILIPFHEHFIIRIDKRKKIVEMDIPEGLLDIN